MVSELRNLGDRVLDEDGVRIGGVLTDESGVSGRNPVEGLVRGEDPRSLLDAAKGEARRNNPELPEALHGELEHVTHETLTLLAGLLDAAGEAVKTLEAGILETVRRDREVVWTLLQTHPSIGAVTAAARLAEIGPDMSQFGAATGELGGHMPRQPRVGRQEPRGPQAQGQRVRATHPVRNRLRGSAQEGHAVRRVQVRPDRAAGHAAHGRGVGHKILRIAWAMLRDGAPHRDPVTDPEALTTRKNLFRSLRLVRQAELLP